MPLWSMITSIMLGLAEEEAADAVLDGVGT